MCIRDRNYQNRNTDRIYNLDGSNTKYKPSTLSKCKNPTIHKSDLSKHTDFYHFETGVFNMSNTSGLYVYKRQVSIMLQQLS